MIKVDKGKVQYSGSVADLLTEFTLIIRRLVDGCDRITKEDIDSCVRTAFMSQDELNDELKKEFGAILDLLVGSKEKEDIDFAKSLFKDIFGEE